MELRTVAYFVAVADAGTVSAAAEVVRVAQPSLSRQLRGLERDLRVELFERSAGRLRLSPAGRALLPYARELLARADALRIAATMQGLGRLERVTIAAPTTTLTDIVSPFIASLAPDDPVPAVVESDALSVDEAQQRGADLVISARRPPAAAASRPLPPLPVWAYVPASHPWAAAGRVALDRLAGATLVLLPARHAARQIVDAALLADDLAPPAAIEASNGTVAQALAAAGRGIAVVSDDPRFGLAPLSVHAADGKRLEIRLSCVWPHDHPAAAVLADLADRIAAYVARTYGTGSTPLT